MKIYGADGIGKSISFVYFTHIKNKYKILYFNLKEIKLASNEDKFNLIIYQILNYFSENFEENDNKILEEQKQIAFQNFIDKSTEIKIILNKIEKFDFWEILIYLLNNNIFKDNILLILDQYKSENDKFNSLQKLEKDIAFDESKSHIKILVSSSINDYGVKEDFILYLIAISELNKNNIIFNDINDININNDSNLSIDDSTDDKFIKNFLDNNYDKTKEKILNYINSNKNEERKKLIKNELIKIIYINELVSAKDLMTEENKKQIEKLVDFNYNPKYYNQFKEKCKYNIPRFDLDSLYIYFAKEKYKTISNKINKFFYTYFKKNENNSRLIIKKINQIQQLIKNKTHLSFFDLIWIMDAIPLKYIKILIAKEKESNINDKKNMITFNKDLLNAKFLLDYSFPFINYILERIIFDMEIINFKDISPSGIGSIAEKAIKKGIFTYEIFKDFIHRNVYSFNIVKKDSIDKKYLEPEIDVFNFKLGFLDDIVDNPLKGKLFSYYISPKNPNNEALDSSILIPSQIFDEDHINFYLIALQITISKTTIKNLEYYHQFTLLAAEKFEKIYKIKILKKYFLFVLIKEYDNKSTQDSLIKAKIPFIFYSKDFKQFFTAKNEPINNVSRFMANDYKIIDKPLEEEQISIKTDKLRDLEMLLQRKRLLTKKDITEEEYYEERKIMFPKDEPINLPASVIKKIEDYFRIKIFHSLKNCKIIRYAFISPIYKVESIIKEKDLFGLIFYKNEIFIFYKGYIYILSGDNSKNIMKIKELENFIQKDLDNKSDIEDAYGQSYNKEKKYENLSKYNLNKPSSIYVYQIKFD